MLTEMDKDIEITSSEEDVKETVQNTENCEPSEALQETSETEEAGTEETEEVKSDDNDKKKSKLFGKKEKKKDKKDIQIEELNDKVIRQMAEFDNFRKRTEKEKSQMFDSGASTMIEKLLPVVDDFERGIAAMSDDDKETSFAQGMEMIYKKMMGILEGAGVTAIEAVGKEFDPNFHNAVMHVEDDEQGENIVIEEFQKGYMYHDSVVRHSMVKVAN